MEGGSKHTTAKKSSKKGPSCNSKPSNNGTTNSKKPLKVVYISNPMKVKTNASDFRALVQGLTGRDADWPDDPSKLKNIPPGCDLADNNGDVYYPHHHHQVSSSTSITSSTSVFQAGHHDLETAGSSSALQRGEMTSSSSSDLGRGGFFQPSDIRYGSYNDDVDDDRVVLIDDDHHHRRQMFFDDFSSAVQPGYRHGR